ncbi:zinc finger protein ZXDC-like [Mercenaria mercenaria]|uniref:zinc finger protein ZXDC-like n=1 Tax=Mercenaria mercenaria TaxID=6596 RepID=UPI00234E8C9F|nr:zinc finger protein ZXDC-like [Mercenaria mercenaria]
MWEHLKESHNVDIKEGKYKSSVFRCTFENCSMEFSREKNRQRHINSVHLKIHYQCKFCGVRYKQIDSLKNHLKVKHDIELTDIQLDKCVIDRKTPYKCPYEECSKQFNHISNFKKHIDAVHLNLRNFQCEFCEQRLKTSSSLKFHIAARHTKDDDKKLYKCDVCSKTFLRKGSLQLHETLHTNAKNYSCSFDGCGKLFRLKSNLTKHQKIHNDVKPHQCEVCEERFSRKTYLETHMYKHTGVKDYSCDICQKSFSQKGNLMTHKLLHNRERTIYKCPRCSQAFNFKSNMKKHLQRHSTHVVMNRIFNKNFEETESEGRASKCTGSSPSQTCSNDTETVSETVKMKANVSTEHKGNFGAFTPNKIWLTPNVLSTLQNGAKAVVLVMNPFKNSLDAKGQGKDMNTVTEENIVDNVTMESDKGGSNYCSVLKPPQQRSVACSTGQKSNEIQVDSVNDKSDRLHAEQETVAISDNLPGFSTTEEHGNDIKSVGHDTSNPVYVCIEDVTHQLSMASKAENEMSNFPKSRVKRPVLAEKNPTFTIEFDSNGMPIARLKEIEQLSGSNSSCVVLNSQQTASEMAKSEHIVNDIVEVTSETDKCVETTGELVAINDSILNVSAENPGIEIERGHVSNLPPTETETVSKTIDKRDCGDMHEISCQNLNTDFQEDINVDSPTVTSSYNQNNHSLLNHHTQYSAVGNMSIPFSASDIPKQLNLRYPISNPLSAESEIFNNSNAVGDVLSNTDERNELQTSDNSDFAVKTDLVVTEVNHLIVTKETDEETPVENF